MHEMQQSAEPGQGEMLRAGRQLRGLTQRELADATGIDQALISKYENGRLVPEADLAVIAEILQLPDEFFRRRTSIHAPNGTSMLMFRRRQSTSAKVQDQVITEIWRLRDTVTILLNSIDLQTLAALPFYEPESHTREEIESIVERVRLELRVAPGPVSNVTRVLESVGIAIFTINLPMKVDALVDSAPGGPPVLVTRNDSLGGRQRFTLAHELGHLVMHHKFNFSYQEIEEQANQFASAFLMPANEIRNKLYDLTMEQLVALSSEWHVSVQAIIRRARDLDVIPDRKYHWWNEQLSRYGFSKAEPVELPTESPTLVKSLVRLHLEELDYTIPELARALFMQEWEFRRIYLNEHTPRMMPKARKPILQLNLKSS